MTEQGEQAKLYILGTAAVLGGVTLGWAASQGWAEEKLPERDPTLSEELGTWAAFNVGLVLLGSSLKEAVEEVGLAKVAGASVGIPVVALLIREIRG